MWIRIGQCLYNFSLVNNIEKVDEAKIKLTSGALWTLLTMENQKERDHIFDLIEIKLNAEYL